LLHLIESRYIKPSAWPNYNRVFGLILSEYLDFVNQSKFRHFTLYHFSVFNVRWALDFDTNTRLSKMGASD